MDMSVITDENKIEELLTRRIGDFEGRSNIWPSKEEVKAKLKEGKKFRVYLGIDPTSTDLHLGHLVPLLFLKQLKELGHVPVLVIGDFTARIGDPSGKTTTRKPLTQNEIEENMKTYLDQVYKILDKDSFEIKYNSEWLDKMPLNKFFEMISSVNVDYLENRSMFKERREKGNPIGIHEFLYPVLQGYDSVAMDIDGEVGGIDQMFNMLMGRDLMKKILNKEKMVFGVRLLEDPSTGKKMSKSEGETIAINDEPSEIRRKVLALDDSMIKVVFELCTEENQDWINDKNKSIPPREFKELLADKLIEMFRGKDKIKEGREPKFGPAVGNIAETIKSFEFAPSIASAKNLISSGAVEVNGKVETNWDVKLGAGDKFRVGKGKFGEVK